MDQLPTIPKARPHIDIRGTQDLQDATTYLSQLNASLDVLTAHKEAKTKPLNAALKEIRKDYKPLEEALEEAISTTKQAIIKYTTALQIEQEEKEAKILQDRRTTNDTKVLKLSEIQSEIPKNVTTDAGSISFSTLKRYRVLDLSKVPLSFLEINDTLVKEAMKNNIDIPGIEYYEEKYIRNYR